MSNQPQYQYELSKLDGIKYISSKYLDSYQNVASRSENIFLKKIFRELYISKSDFVMSINNLIQKSRSNEQLANESLSIPAKYLKMMPEIGYSGLIHNCHRIELVIHEVCKKEYSEIKIQQFKDVLSSFMQRHSKIIEDMESIDFNSLVLTNLINQRK